MLQRWRIHLAKIWVGSETIEDSAGEQLRAEALEDSPGEHLGRETIEDSPGKHLCDEALEDSPEEQLCAEALEDSPGEHLGGEALEDSPGERLGIEVLEDSPGEHLGGEALEELCDGCLDVRVHGDLGQLLHRQQVLAEQRGVGLLQRGHVQLGQLCSTQALRATHLGS